MHFPKKMQLRMPVLQSTAEHDLYMVNQEPEHAVIMETSKVMMLPLMLSH